jgi:small redox-active disulfide protein 2
MKIQVLGSGCPTCKNLYEMVLSVALDLKIPSENIEYSTDIMKLIELGVMSSPALVIDGKCKISGKIPSETEIENILKNSL